ncbi:anti-sigma factor [Pseudomonas aeruginosa]|uniref:anti-sigma factor family protein n=1 Tax=Pseudomonas aeruginosa TaxID=287 RepID=UPI0027C758C3|nr:anti-sigma factor [Pseudomonas aeruginosa]MDQ2578879.1 anti-sigma factor [Pseudomonas aeruginosa]MDQ2605572.1 anti-sigma factor [Pseudomonas aeruginosa]MDT8189524.1 anti-sigma factor [Pseudomonas aeruginosa]MDT8211654.1 anti-sigma factor [Pseudomonas aeruginosa]
MLTCREIATLGSDIIDKKLGFRRRIAVFIHLCQCQNCRLYIKQMELTSAVLQQLAADTDDAEINASLQRIEQLIEKRKV